mmetsp:Transcript_25513/g.33343  ORF Transcript_25513/g.33343 Transcript_25513/m.33343 type:complete len:301 (+) Transcript_25513:111-1013(+)
MIAFKMMSHFSAFRFIAFQTSTFKTPLLLHLDRGYKRSRFNSNWTIRDKGRQLLFEVIMIDNHLLVLNKPAGIPVQGDKTGDPNLLDLTKEWIKEKFGKKGNVYLGLVHRLDRPVSGVVCFARTSKAAARLSASFKQRLPEKVYIAVVQGSLSGTGDLNHFLWRPNSHKNVVKVSEDEKPGSKRAELSWESLGQLEHPSAGVQTILKVKLHTGRRHQIRAQLASIGHPVVGDIKYGAPYQLKDRTLGLHALALKISHPTLQEQLHLCAKIPATWHQRFLNKTVSINTREMHDLLYDTQKK